MLLRLLMQGPLASAATSLVFRTLEASGLNHRTRRSQWRADRLLILCYHGISIRDEHECFDLYITQERLRERLDWLHREGYSFVQLSEGLDHLRKGTLPRQAVSVTFDDGGYDFVARALPVLQSEGVPVTLYMSTYYVARQLPVFDPYLRYLLWLGRGRVLEFPTGGLDAPVQLGNETHRQGAWDRIAAFALKEQLDVMAKDALLRELAQRLGIDDAGLRAERVMHLMNPGEVAGLPDFVDVQLHTHRHRTPDDRTLFRKELEDNSREIVAMRPNHRPGHFCYPSGVYSKSMVTWLGEAGIESATTCDPEIAERDTPALLLPRFIDTMDVSEDKFAAWAAGTAPLIRRRVRRTRPPDGTYGGQ